MTPNFSAGSSQFWQEIYPPGSLGTGPGQGYRDFYPAPLPDGRQIILPIRPIDDGKNALASLIVNQASFAVLDALAQGLAEQLRPLQPEIVVGLPTLGLTLAAELARKLGHSRYVAMSTSKKFWYDETLSFPLRSITSPDQQKRLYMDPRMLPLLTGKRVLLVDDVLSSGTSIKAGYDLLQRCTITPIGIGGAMLQTQRWRDTLAADDPALPEQVYAVFQTPLLHPTPSGVWQPASGEQ